jgi:hypothetical protein
VEHVLDILLPDAAREVQVPDAVDQQGGEAGGERCGYRAARDEDVAVIELVGGVDARNCSSAVCPLAVLAPKSTPFRPCSDKMAVVWASALAAAWWRMVSPPGVRTQ